MKELAVSCDLKDVFRKINSVSQCVCHDREDGGHFSEKQLNGASFLFFFFNVNLFI